MVVEKQIFGSSSFRVTNSPYPDAHSLHEDEFEDWYPGGHDSQHALCSWSGVGLPITDGKPVRILLFSHVTEGQGVLGGGEGGVTTGGGGAGDVTTGGVGGGGLAGEHS